MPEKIPAQEKITAACHPWQTETVNQLLSLQSQQQLPHALLIELETAADSAAFGWYLLSALICQAEEGAVKPCGVCASCQLMQANHYPDFTYTTLVEDEKTHKLNRDIRIDQVRKLIHQLNLTDSMSQGRFALIYPAEKMNASAANSLLKTLEEPSSGATLVLMTHQASRLPITIRSRCQRWLVRNPETDQALAWLAEQGIAPDMAKNYLPLAHGDPQRVLELESQGFIEAQQNFERLFDQFAADRINAVAIVNGLKDYDEAMLRQLVRNKLIDKARSMATPAMTVQIKQSLIDVLDLLKKSDRNLRASENNLNLLLQLEDVLISAKTIVNRG